jgi:hypothetical protein
MKMEDPVKSVIKGAVFFTLIGPLLGGGLMFLLIGWSNGFGGDGSWAPGVALAGVLSFTVFSYVLGAAPAFATGLIACSLMRRIRSRWLFIGMSMMVSMIAGYVFDWICGSAHKTTALIGIIPAAVTSWLWWSRRRAGQALPCRMPHNPENGS